MRRHLLAATALTTSILFLVPGAQAQPATFSWSGFYAGLTAGIVQSNTQLNFDYSDASNSPPQVVLPMLGGSGGVVLGVSFQQGKFVYGLQADGSLMTLASSYSSAKTDTAAGVNVDAQLSGLLDLRARLGLANGPLLFFASAGIAATHETFNATIYDSDGTYGDVTTAHGDGIAVGPILGMGVEYAVNDNVSLTAEGTIASLGGVTATGDNGKGQYHVGSTAPVIGARAGVNFHF